MSRLFNGQPIRSVLIGEGDRDADRERERSRDLDSDRGRSAAAQLLNRIIEYRGHLSTEAELRAPRNASDTAIGAFQRVPVFRLDLTK